MLTFVFLNHRFLLLMSWERLTSGRFTLLLGTLVGAFQKRHNVRNIVTTARGCLCWKLCAIMTVPQDILVDLLNNVNRGGLSSPIEICFSLCVLAYIYFPNVKSDETKMLLLLKAENQQTVFVENVMAKLDDNLRSLACDSDQNHKITVKILRCLFNCFSKNRKGQLQKRQKKKTK